MVKLPQYFDILIENGYDDLESVGDVTMEELSQIGIDKIGHRKKILKHALLLKDDITPLSQRELNLGWTANTMRHNGHQSHINNPTLSPNSANGGPSGSTLSGQSGHSYLLYEYIWSEHDSNDMNELSHIPWGAYSATNNTHTGLNQINEQLNLSKNF